MHLLNLACFFIFFTAITSCSNKTGKVEAPVDTPTSGAIAISADESLASIIKNEVETFTNIYSDARINVNYLPEQDVFEDFINNKVEVAIVSRTLNETETKYLRELGVAPHQIKMGTDAVAFIVNKQNPDSNISYRGINEILDGRIINWKNLNEKSNLDSLVLVFDNNRSSTIRFLKEEVLKGKELTKKAYAVDSNAAVIRYVEENQNAMGVLSVNSISNKVDSNTHRFLSRIQVVGISNPDSIDQNIFYRPYRFNMLYLKYPLLRDFFLLNRETHIGLGTGFATFMISQDGQLIIHQAGLVAAKQPVRVIELKNEF